MTDYTVFVSMNIDGIRRVFIYTLESLGGATIFFNKVTKDRDVINALLIGPNGHVFVEYEAENV